MMSEIARLHGLAQRAAIFLPNILKKAATSLPIIPSYETTNELK